MRHNVSVYAAKIDTLGERAEDTFQVLGEPLNTPAGVEALVAEIREALKWVG